MGGPPAGNPPDGETCLRRHDALETTDHGPIVSLARESDGLVEVVTAWYAETGVPPADRPALAAHRQHLPAALDQVLSVAIGPFLARAAEVAAQSAPLAEWGRPWCPCCGSEPEFAARDRRRRAGADVRALRSAMAVAVRGMSVVRDPRREPAGHAGEPRPQIPCLRLQRVPPVLEGI